MEMKSTVMTRRYKDKVYRMYLITVYIILMFLVFSKASEVRQKKPILIVSYVQLPFKKTEKLR